MNDRQILPAGTLLQQGKYRIEHTLGRGSFGITYLAAATIKMTGALGEMETEIHVAVKEFFMSDINSRSHDGTSVEGSSGTVFANYRRKFRKEAENLARLSHDNIVHVIDVFDENNTTYYVMQYVDGGSLDDYIASRGRLSEGETFAILRDVGAALSYMHRHKMLHLDLKPKNIMRRGSDGHIFLIDFGLSKYFTEGGEPESSTTIGHGTPGYAPLEQARYRHDGSFPATIDVYALGATAFKMLTGKRPPEASDILNDGFPSDDLLSLGVSRPTMESIRRAMSAERRSRYQTVDEFLSALGLFDHAAASMPSASESEDTYVISVVQSNIDNHLEKHHQNDSITEPVSAPVSAQPDYVPPTTYRDCWRSAWRNKLNFKGRASRREFWSVWPVMLLIWYVWFELFRILYGISIIGEHIIWINVFSLCVLLFVASTIGLEIRRLRDSGHSPLWAVAFNIVFVIPWYIYIGLNEYLYDLLWCYLSGDTDNFGPVNFVKFIRLAITNDGVSQGITGLWAIFVVLPMCIFLSQRSAFDRKK